jgi:Leucine-rich repeat (LRR) protein
LTALPNFSKLLYLWNLQIDENSLDFADLDSAHFVRDSLEFFVYSPQKRIAITENAGADYTTLSFQLQGSRSRIKWFENGTWLSKDSLPTLKITNSKSAVYHCEIRDSIYPELVLRTVSKAYNTVQGVIASDLTALQKLYESTSGDNWSMKSNWLTDTIVSSWYGIKTMDYRVVQIDLNSNRLQGDIPPEIGMLSGLTHLAMTKNKISTIPPEIQNLKYLNDFNLSDNSISTIPSEIGNLDTLQQLFLNNNAITSLPVELFNLKNIHKIEITGNQLSSIPKEIENADTLTSLDLSGNLISRIPVELTKIKSLQMLSLKNNKLDSLPDEIANLNQLLSLDISANNLDTLPHLGDLKKIMQLYVNNNYLDFGDFEKDSIDFDTLNQVKYAPQAQIPLIYRQSGNNIFLKAHADGTSNNYKWLKDGVEVQNGTVDSLVIGTTGSDGEYHCEITNTNFLVLTLLSGSMHLPAGISDEEYQALVSIYNKTNGSSWTTNTNWLSDNPVDTWFGVSVVNHSVSAINLNNNNLQGKIPNEFRALSNLNSLKLAKNLLTDTVPKALGYLNNLTDLNLAANQLTKAIPVQLCALSNLEFLDLDSNMIVDLPDFKNLTHLKYLYVRNNMLTFEDLEPNMAVPSLAFAYSPQPNIGTVQNYTLEQGDAFTIKPNVSGQYNVYAWYRNKSLIVGQTDASLYIPDFSNINTGEYNCAITNTKVPGLLLLTNTITLNQIFRVTFNVTDSKGWLKGATIELQGYGQKITNILGEAVFKNINAANEMTYTISADKHNLYSSTVDVTDSNVIVDIQLGITGINDYNLPEIKLYPNPAKDFFYLDLQYLPKEQTVFEISDLCGKIIVQQHHPLLHNTLDLSNYSAGTYFVKVYTNQKIIYQQKIIVLK